MDFSQVRRSVLPFDEEAARQAHVRWNSIAKPIGSLGRLEDTIVKIAGLTGTARVSLNKRAVLVFCADNGVIAQGVAQTPGEITATMASFIAAGRSAVCCMARQARADVMTIDMGMFRQVDTNGLINRRIADGTRDMSQGPAMTRNEAIRAIQTGIELAGLCKEQGYEIIATGEMGIGNTTTSAALAAVLLQRPVPEVTGRGAGLSDDGLVRKQTVIAQAIAVNQPDPSDPLDVLHKVGGFDIAALCGVFIGGILYRIPVLIDGLISSVAALLASRMVPESVLAMLPSHVSAEPAGSMILEALGLMPLISAGMRLGEGTGAVSALPILDMALSVYDDLMTFADIGMA